MKITLFNAKNYEIEWFNQINKTYQLSLNFVLEPLTESTLSLAKDSEVLCCFVHDTLNAIVLEKLAQLGVKLILLRSAGFDHVDIAYAKRVGIRVANVPQYSPQAIAEHAVLLLLALCKKFTTAQENIQQQNFLLDNLLGIELQNKTIGIIGTGKIGKVFARIMAGFGARLLGFDLIEDPACLAMGINYVTLHELYQQSDIISLHCTLNTQTFHLINKQSLAQMKRCPYLINTARGKLIDTNALIQALSQKIIAGAGLDVYEHEEHLFFQDLRQETIIDPLWKSLTQQENVIITAHQAFFTDTALEAIVSTTLANAKAYFTHAPLNHLLTM